MGKNKKVAFLSNIFFAFNISWMMLGSVFIGFLLGRWVSKVSGIDWLVVVFSLIGAIGGMGAVWKYYKGLK